MDTRLVYVEEYQEEMDIDNLGGTLCDELDSYCEDLSKEPGMTREETEDDPDMSGYSFLWSDKASGMIEEETSRLYSILSKYYTDDEIQDNDISIESHWYKEME